jgi:hypothetical protein
VGNTVIENYEPSDEGWGIVVGPFIRRQPEDEHDDVDVDHHDDDDDVAE